MARRPAQIPKPENLNTPAAEAVWLLTQVRRVRQLFFCRRESIPMIARHVGWAEEKVRRVVQGKEYGTIGWDFDGDT